MKDLSQRKSEAKERQEAYKVLTTSQKVILLDLKLGGGKGAKRQRERLATQLIKESEGRVAKVETVEALIPGIGRQREPKKPYQKPKRS